MKKNFLQDVVPASQKRSIRDIPLPVHKETPTMKKEIKPKARVREEEQEEIFEPNESSQEDKYEEPAQEENSYVEKRTRPTSKKRRFKRKLFTVVVLCIAVFGGVLLSRTDAKITINPKKVTQEVNLTLPLDETNKLATKTQISKTATKTLPATAEQQVEKQASGKIKIINRHKEVPQELVKNTRFQTPNGLIYRIRDSIEIPGYTMNGSTLVPGTLEAEVFADSAGEEYNTSNAKFTIPGFSGKEQFDKITAESVGEIAGGYIGVRKVVSDDAKEQAQKDLETQLKSEVEQTQKESTEYVLVPDIATLSYGEIQDKAEGDSVVLSLTARVDAYSFVKKDLSNYIGQSSISGASNTDMFNIDMSKLSFLVEEETIKITGTSLITYLTDIEKLKSDFANKKRSEALTIIDSYTSFEKASADLSPFWKSRFPEDISKIEVIISE